MSDLGSVATGHASTTAAAIEVLRAGGTAADAAVAAALAAGVCEPLLMGLGGGMIATLREGATGAVHIVDSMSLFPGRGIGLKPRDFRALSVDYGPTTQTFHAGRGSTAVPTVAPGLELIWKRWGTLPLEAVAAPAIRLARDGWVTTRGTEVVATMLETITSIGPCSNALFNPDGRPLGAGSRVCIPAMAEALEAFAADGARPFTSGRYAQALVAEFGPPNGSLTIEDLAGFEPTVTSPLRIEYRGGTLYVPPVPCTGGALLGFGLSVLDKVCPVDADRIEAARAFAAVMAATERARAEGFDEGFFEPGAVEGLLSDENIQHHVRTTLADMERSRRGGDSPPGVSGPGPGGTPGNTTHISVVDAAGNAVALTSSNGETCGFLWPGADIPVNNFLGEDDIHPMGFHMGAPGDAMRTMMTPSLMVGPSGGLLAMGTGGSNRIRTAMLQVVRHIIDEGEGLEAAIMEPRIHVEDGAVQVEDLRMGHAFLAAIGGGHRHVTRFEGRHLYFGGVHTAGRRADGTFEAFGDPRRAGDGRIAR